MMCCGANLKKENIIVLSEAQGRRIFKKELAQIKKENKMFSCVEKAFVKLIKRKKG